LSRARFRTARTAGLALVAVGVLLLGSLPAAADTTAQPLPFTQDWSNTGLITTNDDWSGVPGVIGYRGDGLVAVPGADPQTITADGSATPVDVNANQTNPNTFTTGGVAEFELTNPVVALQGSGTADAPHVVLALDTTDKDEITVFYNLRDIDGSADNAVQQVALQYRVGATGDFTNLPAGYVADATTGPNLATQVTPVSVLLPAAAEDQPLVQVRVITADAAGSDEWVGVDDISVTGGDVPPPDAAPFVSSTSPAPGAVDVPTSSNVDITFSEPVTVSVATFTISCATSGTHALGLSGGPATFTLDPDTDFATDETCTVTVDDVGVSDVDTTDPPDNMAADHVFSFSTVAPTYAIHQIQGAAHISPLNGENTSGVPGVVTSVRSNGFNMQEPTGDGNPATSDAIFVFTDSAPTVAVGEAVLVSGTIQEFRPGGSASANLTTTEIANPVVTPSGPGAAITPTVVGPGGRVPPTTIIEDDASGDVETGGVFDPAQDGIDFYESLEAMLVRVNDAVAVGPTNGFGEIPVLAANGAGAGVRTARDGIVIRPADFNPERIILDDVLAPTPQVNVKDRLPGAIRAVVDYSFGNFKFLVLATPAAVDGRLRREVTDDPGRRDLTVATFNVENLDPGDGAPKFAELADLIVDNVKAPDIIAIEEIQDNNGPTNDSITDASVTWQTLIATIDAVGGPQYDWRQIDPVDDQDGGEPGGNIRVGFLFRTDRPLSFVDRPGGTPTTPNAVVETPNGAELLYSPGRIDPSNGAFTNSRKPLAAEFEFRGRRLFVIANHFNSKGGDDPLFGRFQPPVQHTQVQRLQQAQVVHDFVDAIEAADSQANVVVAGDLNDFEFSTPLETLEGAGLLPLIETLPQRQRYTYVFDGNSQTLDHILINEELADQSFEYDVVHVNSEFHDQASDHEPQVARLEVRGRSVP
jgi:predicted extracellular nuclease